MALHLVRFMRFGPATLIGLLLTACGGPIPEDEALIDELRLDRAGFEEAIGVACQSPHVTSFEMRGKRTPETVPALLSSVRVQSLQTFATNHDIGRMYFECGPPVYASFDMASVGPGVSGQLKRLIFSPAGIARNNGGALVADTDLAVDAENEKWIAVHRDIGGGWFIYNSR